MKHSVGIVGLGQIGMTYDSDFVSTSNYLSHAKSFNHHPNFRVDLLVDIASCARELAKSNFSEAKVYESIDEVTTFPDVLVLAANQKVNIDLYKRLRDKKEIKLFVIEKPFWDVAQFDAQDFDNEGRSRIYINYIRKSLPYYQNLKAQFAESIFGEPITANIFYSKGLRNNGSHVLDLINYIFEPDQISVQSVFSNKNDFSADDLSYSFVLQITTKNRLIPIVFNAIDEQKYSVIEIDFFFERKRIRCIDFGGKIQEYDLAVDPLFPGYTNLLPAEDFVSAELNKYGIFTCDLLHEILSERVDNPSPIQNEIAIFELVKKIKYFE